MALTRAVLEPPRAHMFVVTAETRKQFSPPLIACTSFSNAIRLLKIRVVYSSRGRVLIARKTRIDESFLEDVVGLLSQVLFWHLCFSRRKRGLAIGRGDPSLGEWDVICRLRRTSSTYATRLHFRGHTQISAPPPPTYRLSFPHPLGLAIWDFAER